MIIAHRGGIAGTTIIENSLKAFQRAMDMGCDGIECDLRLSGDNKIVVCHDAEINCIPLEVLTTKELKEMSVCTLEELLKLSLSNEYKGLLNLEIKEYGINKNVCEILNKYKLLHSHILITSFLHPVVKNLKEMFENEYQSVKVSSSSATVCPIQFGLLYRCLPITLDHILSDTNYIIAMSIHVIPWDQKDYQVLKNNANRIFVYTVNDPLQIKSLLDDGISVITDTVHNSAPKK